MLLISLGRDPHILCLLSQLSFQLPLQSASLHLGHQCSELPPPLVGPPVLHVVFALAPVAAAFVLAHFIAFVLALPAASAPVLLVTSHSRGLHTQHSVVSSDSHAYTSCLL